MDYFYTKNRGVFRTSLRTVVYSTQFFLFTWLSCEISMPFVVVMKLDFHNQNRKCWRKFKDIWDTCEHVKWGGMKLLCNLKHFHFCTIYRDKIEMNWSSGSTLHHHHQLLVKWFIGLNEIWECGGKGEGANIAWNIGHNFSLQFFFYFLWMDGKN